MKYEIYLRMLVESENKQNAMILGNIIKEDILITKPDVDVVEVFHGAKIRTIKKE